ncbi:MAG: hypothetical protein ABI556_13855 [Gemmatimonadales bacterium]
MRSIFRKAIGAALVLGACALASPPDAQAQSKKAKAKKADAVALANAHRAHVKLHELCEDGVWSIHVPNPCLSHGGKVARGTRAAAKLKDREVLAAARRSRAEVVTASPTSGTH